MALLEDCESIQLSIMHVVDGLIKGTLDPTRARLTIQALRIARNAKNVRFDAHDHGVMAQPIVREVPDYARQYLIEHPEFGTPLESKKEQINPTPEPQPTPDARSAGAPARVAATNAVVQIEAQAASEVAPQATQKKATQKNETAERAVEPAAERRKNAAHGASRGTKLPCVYDHGRGDGAVWFDGAFTNFSPPLKMVVRPQVPVCPGMRSE